MFVFWPLVLLGLWKLTDPRHLGHYAVFTTAARRFWNGQSAYGSDFGGGVGFYFYSPSCAMFLFRPFASLPDQVGAVLYMGLSVLVFVWGAKLWFARLKVDRKRFDTFLVLVAPAMYAALLASKVELLMVGMVFCALATARSRPVVAGVVLGILVNWKFQPIPTALLMSLALYLTDRKLVALRFFSGVVAGFVGFSVLPLVFLERLFLLSEMQLWRESLSGFVAESYFHFDTIYKFLYQNFDWIVPYGWTRIFAVVLGALLALLLYGRFRPVTDHQTPQRQNAALVLAAAFGGFFTVLASPLHQNNALIHLAYGAVWIVLLYGGDFWRGHWSRQKVTVVALWGFIALAYSDLMGKTLRFWFVDHALKPVAVLVLLTVVAVIEFQNARKTGELQLR